MVSIKPRSAEIHPGPGFRISKRVTRPAPELISKYSQFETPDISDLMNRLYTMAPVIRNVVNEQTICGPACTVKVFPGDNLMIHKALDVARPGDIVVVDAGTSTNAVLGDLVAQKARHRGIAAFVVDGLVRDVAGLIQVGLPIFSRGVTAVGPLHRGPGEINYPVSCGGIVVNPGDIIRGDSSGICVVRQDFAQEIMDRLVTQRDAMEAYVADVRRGEFSNAWVDQVLLEANCPFTE